MDITALATILGTGIGAGLASFTAAHSVSKKRESKVQKEQEDHGERLKGVEGQVSALQASVSTQSHRIEKVEDQLIRHSELIHHAVTDDEFAAHTLDTTRSLSSIHEKLGRAIGGLEAWQRYAPNKRE